ncbi:S8 family peptidase [Nonomuraea sediminis]|uniref:S8 family peptidase n=1 Tax=Nonomuraea sediminis TaxID=2835864 RepID=UPI001BDBDFD6|nr:S8 family serine peptidase [Nonomuraea sediminis]
MRRVARGLTALALAGAMTACTSSSGAPAARSGPPGQFLVFYGDGQQAQALEAIRRAGGTAESTEAKLGYVLAKGSGDAFVNRVGADASVVGVSADREIGYASALDDTGGAARRTGFPDASALSASKGEPLAPRQWDMRMIGADRAHAKLPGSRKVLVGVIDTGIDGNHPDIAPNFNRELSRNFVTDKPKDSEGDRLDGPCEVATCKDPVDEDDDGHGTHVASTIASPINGIGIAGVAPDVQLVNIRAGQDSGFFFLKPSLDALTYAGDIGVDVVNMSYYVDPWLFNCRDNPADSKKQQLEQRAIITGMQRAIDYARKKGVTVISALGNGSSDLGHPKVDDDSPGYPRGDQKTRKIDNSCLNVPAESKGVISVSALGPSGRKAPYSDYGLEQTDVSAPGGDDLDDDGGSQARTILAAAPEGALRSQGKLDRSGKPKSDDVVRSCVNGSCSYYQYMEGTSMAAPHASGVAALIVSRFGKIGPDKVEKLLYKSATKHACPKPRKYSYGSESHRCEGGKAKNGFYGHGIVSALGAVTVKP